MKKIILLLLPICLFAQVKKVERFEDRVYLTDTVTNETSVFPSGSISALLLPDGRIELLNGNERWTLPLSTSQIVDSQGSTVTFDELTDILRPERQWAFFNATSTNTTIVSGVSGKRILVVYMVLASDDDTTWRFESTSGGDPLTAVMTMHSNSTVLSLGPENGQVVLSNEKGIFKATNAGELLNLEKGSGDISGYICYMLID